MKPLKISAIFQICHSALDAESNIYNSLEIPACAGMTFLMIFSKVSNIFHAANALLCLKFLVLPG